MPTYVYACDKCSKQFEQFQRFSEEPLTVCPCGQEGSVRRVFQPVGIVFKGGGWYATDSRSTKSTGGNDTADDSAAPAPAKETEAAPVPEKTTTTTDSHTR
ncbi:MAG: zinc ribbon domain-containing protein [Chloroflexaceae bacterium]|nr:zinc ribbon domain-containing protein [Chloroflexaceae bacterium]